MFKLNNLRKLSLIFISLVAFSGVVATKVAAQPYEGRPNEQGRILPVPGGTRIKFQSLNATDWAKRYVNSLMPGGLERVGWEWVHEYTAQNCPPGFTIIPQANNAGGSRYFPEYRWSPPTPEGAFDPNYNRILPIPSRNPVGNAGFFGLGFVTHGYDRTFSIINNVFRERMGDQIWQQIRSFSFRVTPFRREWVLNYQYVPVTLQAIEMHRSIAEVNAPSADFLSGDSTLVVYPMIGQPQRPLIIGNRIIPPQPPALPPAPDWITDSVAICSAPLVGAKGEICGDNICQADANENCYTCAEDCGVCANECGNGIVEPSLGEQCDDGNFVGGDGCTSNCKAEVCGDGKVDYSAGESCDDGNNVDMDGCSSNCQKESCGDCILQPELGEQCEPSLDQSCPSDCYYTNVPPPTYAPSDYLHGVVIMNPPPSAGDLTNFPWVLDFFNSTVGTATPAPTVQYPTPTYGATYAPTQLPTVQYPTATAAMETATPVSTVTPTSAVTETIAPTQTIEFSTATPTQAPTMTPTMESTPTLVPTATATW